VKIVEDIALKKGMTLDDLLHEFGKSGGFTSRYLSEAADIIERMIKDRETRVFLSFPACIVATGTRGVITEMVKRKWVDVIITTCGTLDHDLARVWKDYFHGSFFADDRELHRKNIHRIGNIFVPVESYGKILEEKLQPIIEKLYEKRKSWSTRDLIWEIGKHLEDEKRKEESIVYQAYRNKIPIFVPGITDGAVGSQLWLFYQTHRDFSIDLLKDEQNLCDIIFESRKTGGIIVGGGISKHHLIWWNQFKEGLDYAVYLTTALEYDGSLSGAQTREAISWGKIKEKAHHVTVMGDATITLPILIAAMLERFD